MKLLLHLTMVAMLILGSGKLNAAEPALIAHYREFSYEAHQNEAASFATSAYTVSPITSAAAAAQSAEEVFLEKYGDYILLEKPFAVFLMTHMMFGM